MTEKEEKPSTHISFLSVARVILERCRLFASDFRHYRSFYPAEAKDGRMLLREAGHQYLRAYDMLLQAIEERGDIKAENAEDLAILTDEVEREIKEIKAYEALRKGRVKELALLSSLSSGNIYIPRSLTQIKECTLEVENFIDALITHIGLFLIAYSPTTIDPDDTEAVKPFEAIGELLKGTKQNLSTLQALGTARTNSGNQR